VQLFELDDVQTQPFAVSPALREMGVALALTGDAGARRLWLVAAYAGPRCD